MWYSANDGVDKASIRLLYNYALLKSEAQK